MISYDVYTEGLKEYGIDFETSEMAQRAYEDAIDNMGRCDGIYNAVLEDDRLYIVCDNGTLHDFIRNYEEV